MRQLWRGEKPIATYLLLAAAGIAVPLAIAEIAWQWNRTRLRLWLLRRLGGSTVHKTPSGWEHFFLSNRWAYVRVTLEAGRASAGFTAEGKGMNPTMLSANVDAPAAPPPPPSDAASSARPPKPSGQ